MKLNNKGMTLMELLISIALIGLILVFLLQLLNDLEHEVDNNNYAFNNQINRAEAIYTIESDLQKYNLVGIEDASNDENIVIKFHYIKNNDIVTAILTSSKKEYEDEFLDIKNKYYLRYTSYNGEKYSWEMKGARIDTCGLFNYYIDNSSNNYYFKINIPIYNSVYHEKNNEDKNNAVDDIEITYAGNKNDLDITNNSYLTRNNKIEKKIGTCTN